MSEEIVDVNTAVEQEQDTPCWTFLSNHALVMMCLVNDPTSRIRDIAVQVGITERAVQRILTELEADGYLQRHREGRRNFYVVDLTQPIRQPMVEHSLVSDLLRLRLRNHDNTIQGEGPSVVDHDRQIGPKKNPDKKPATRNTREKIREILRFFFGTLLSVDSGRDNIP